MAGRTLILASDHGHVIDRQTEYWESDRGERWRSAASTSRSGELEVKGQRVVADGGKLIALWSEKIRFGMKKMVTTVASPRRRCLRRWPSCAIDREASRWLVGSGSVSAGMVGLPATRNHATAESN